MGAAPRPYTPEHLGREVLNTQSALEGERKQVTVLLADVAGSLAMARELEPEDSHVVMDGFFALALDAVHAEQGTINQFRGDGFMALFGAPLARGDESLHALRAALAIRRATESYSRSVRARFGVPFVVRMGIHAGLVWVGSIGTALRRDYTAEGPTVGMAARLEEAAAPGQILVAEETARRVESYVDLREVGRRELKGLPEPVTVFEVVGAPGAESRFDVERVRGLTPFVGRERELGELVSRVSQLAPGRALWLEVRGEAGSGKSRLALEARERTAGGGPGWLEGRCREGDASRAYAAWIDLLRRWVDGAAGGDAAAKLVRLLVGEEGARSAQAVAAAVRELLDEFFGTTPARLLFEDVHWLDPSSRRVAELLLRDPPGCGVAFVATTRPEAWIEWDARLPVTRIELGRLDPEASAALASCLLGSEAAAEPLVVLAAERGAGNPLFVEELARSLRDGPEPVRDSARLEMAWRRAPQRIPDTLEGVIEARIDALPDPTKRLLQTAAVVERPFAPAFLEAIDLEAGERLPELLETLRDRELLVSRGGALEFRHVLFREVAYRQILRERRQRLHARCAEALDATTDRGQPETASRIGSHFDRAGEPSRAVHHLTRAGRGYLELTASEEAVAHLRRAWELLAEAEQGGASPRASVGLSLAAALNSLDRAGEASAVLESLDDDELGSEDRRRLADACVQMGWIRYSEAGDVPAARRLLERGISLASGKDPALRTVATGHAYRSRVEHLDGELERAVESAQRLAELATAGGDRFGLLLGRSNEGLVRCDAGEVRAALELCEEAARLAEEARHEVGISLTQSAVAKALVFRGSPEEALRAAERARSVGGRCGQIAALYNAEVWSGEAHLLLGDPARAAECLGRLAEINDRWPTTLDNCARGALEAGRLDEAIELATRCLEAEPPRLVRARVLRTLGLALGLARPAEADRADQALAESVSLCDSLGLRPHLAHAWCALAEVSRERGHGERAADYARRAAEEWEACEMPGHAALARRVLDGS